MSIFDSIINDVSSLGDSLGDLDFSNVGRAALSAMNSNKQSSGDSSAAAYNMLSRLETKTQQPYSVGGMRASKSDPVASVDPKQLEAEWLRRLDRYTSIAQTTGFNPRK